MIERSSRWPWLFLTRCCFLLPVLSIACGPSDPPAPTASAMEAPVRNSEKPRETVTQPTDTDTTTTDSDSASSESPDSPFSAIQALKRPPGQRFTTPGMIRHIVSFSAPIARMHMSPLSGLTVSAGDQVYNVTSKGIVRWRIVAGAEHVVYPLQQHQTEMLWSRTFQRLSGILPRGRTSWNRKLQGDIRVDSAGNLYVFDASTVSALAGNGKDRWRAVMNEYRHLEGPWSCDEGVLLQGSRGLSGAAILLSHQGAIIRQLELARSTIVLGVSSRCEPLIWLNGKVAMLDSRGGERWSVTFPGIPLMRRTTNGILLGVSAPNDQIHLREFDESGIERISSVLNIEGRIMDMGFLEHNGRLPVLGLCIGVASQCARPGGNRGPYNTILTENAAGDFVASIRSPHGHAAFVDYGNDGYLLSNSSAENATELTLYDTKNLVVWNTLIPGRLTTPPVAGPDGALYVATCDGWDCKANNRLIAMTALASPQ